MRLNATPLLVIAIALWLPAISLCVSLFGCQTGTSGLMRPLDPQVERGVTNTVSILTQTGAAAAPQPIATAIEAGGAAVLALLAAWQGLTHTRVKTLEANVPIQNVPPKV